MPLGWHCKQDLKIGKLPHQDLGQMQMCVNYYHQERAPAGDHPPIGLVLCADKNEAVVLYTPGGEQSRIRAVCTETLSLPAAISS